jgi:hypothetical protein
MHIGEAKAAPLVSMRQARVIEPHQVQNGRLQIMHVHGSGREVIFARLEAIARGVDEVIA